MRPKGMLSRCLRAITTVFTVVVVVGAGWFVLGEFRQSEAAHAVQSFSMVNHQTGQIEQSLDTARAFIGTELASNYEIADVADIDALLAQWSPRYERARVSYRKFDAAIASAEASAEAYLAAQQALTEQFHDEGQRAMAQESDAQQERQYEQWRANAREVRDRALEIMRRLSDMDTTLKKLKLQADFSFDVTGFDQIPSEILALGTELEQFRAASDTIRASIASPFDSEAK